MKISFQSFFQLRLKYNFIFILLIVILAKSNTQTIYKDYLLSTNTSNIFNLYDSLNLYYSENPLGKPFISRIEFRTQTDEFRLDKQEYTLRLRTSDPFNNRYQNKINQIEKGKIDLMKGAQLADKLYLKYKTIGKFESLRSLVTNLKEQKLLTQKLVLLYKEPMILQGKENLEKYYESNLKLNKTESELSDALFEYDQLHSEIFKDKNPIVEATNSLNITLIKNYIDEFKEKNAGLEAEILNFDITKSKMELDQKRSNDNKILDHVQFQYQSDPNDILEKKLSLGVGLRIPQLIANRYQKEEYQLKLFKLKIENEEIEEKKAARIALIKNKIGQLYNSYEFYQSQSNSMSKLFNTDSLLNKGFFDAELLLQVKLQETRINQQLAELNSEAISLFIDFLYYTDHFYFQPKFYYLTIPFREM